MKHRDDLTRGLPLPSTWVNTLMEFIGSAALNFRLDRLNATTLSVPAGAGNDQVAIAIEGKWRWNVAQVTAAAPAGAADTYGVYVTANPNDFTADDPTDLTNYAFGLMIRTTAQGPPPVAGATTHSRKIANAVWDGAAITAIVPLVPGVAVGSAPLLTARYAAGLGLISDGAGGWTVVAPDSPAATAAMRTLGTGAQQAAAGNDSRFSDQRTPADGSVTNAKVAAAAAIAMSKLSLAITDAQVAAGAAIAMSKLSLAITNAEVASGAAIAQSKLALAITDAQVAAGAAIAESKLTLASDAAAGTASRRTLGSGAQQAAPGNDARFSDMRTPVDESVTSTKLSNGLAGLLAVSQPGEVRRGKSIIDTEDFLTFTTVEQGAFTYKTLAVPDRVTGVLVGAADSLLLIEFHALWRLTAADGSSQPAGVTGNPSMRANIFIGGNRPVAVGATILPDASVQMLIGAGPSTRGIQFYRALALTNRGMRSHDGTISANGDEPASPIPIPVGLTQLDTPMLGVDVMPYGRGFAVRGLPAGTYDVEVRYQLQAATATERLYVKKRRLWAKAEDY